MSIYISPDFQPSRKFFYFMILGSVLLAIMLITDGGPDRNFGIGVLVSSIIALALGSIIIHTEKFRDRVFGLVSCPPCKKKTISIKDKLKAKTHGKSDAKCSSCKRLISLPKIYLLHSVALVFLPIVAVIILQSMAALFVTAWLSGILYLVYFGRCLGVVRQKT